MELFLANPLIAFCCGILLLFTVRKANARIQGRRGPLVLVPDRWHDINRSKLFQPLYDILKLFSKKTMIPATASLLFIVSPFLALLSAILASVFVPFAGISYSYSYDLVVLFYFLMGEILFVIMGGITSASLFAVIGGVREIELMLTNEMPFILGTFALAITYNTLSIREMMGFNLLINPFAAAVVFIAILVKLHMKPFDISEAESEIVAGLTTEYSGKLLGLLEITRVIMIAVLISLFVDLFLWVPSEGILSWVVFLAEVFCTAILVSIVHSLFGRFRIDQATWWLYRFPLLLSIIAILVAVIQRYLL